MRLSVAFKNNRGFRLVGLLIGLKEGENPPVVVFAHGLNSGKDSPRNTKIAEGLNEAGIATLLMDFTGHGESEGTMSDATVEQLAYDLESALTFLNSIQGIDTDRIGVCGSSLGGTAAIVAASRDPRMKALVLRNAPAEGYYRFADMVTIPTLIVQGADDPVLEESEKLYKHLRGEKRIEIISGAGHLWEGEEQLRQARAAIASWFVETLGPVLLRKI